MGRVGRKEVHTHTETKQRAKYREVTVAWEENLKEDVEAIALHFRYISVRAEGCTGER